MQVRLLGVQKWQPDNGPISYKVYYSADNSKAGERIENENVQATYTYFGEKPVDLKCTEDGFRQLSQITPGELVELSLSPNPMNPRFNVCDGGEKVEF